MKFSQMLYERPELEATKQRLSALIDVFEAAPDGESAEKAYLEIDAFNGHVRTMRTLAHIRHTLDTNDQFYDAEQTYFDQTMPLLQELYQRVEKALLASPHRGHLEVKYGSLMFKNIEISLKTFKPEIVADLQTENRLRSEYDKLIASAQIAFDGKTLTLAQITPYHQDPDRAVRKASMEARAAWFEAQSEKLDELYDALVKVRAVIAKKLGFQNFIELGYCRMGRNCYTEKEVRGFRDGVRKYAVPVAARLKKEQAERIGQSEITMIDDAFEYPTGNANPIGSPEQIFAHGRTMYHELSPETAEFIDFMLENELFDVLTRPGKSAGGYCADIPDHKAPFIFANFNGTAGDIDVLTHEAGHAFAGYVSRDLAPSALQDYTNETAEVHSMSMEFFTWPWMEGFFGDAVGKYRYSHLSSAMTFIPYGTMVDDYQHHVYAHPDMTPAQRNKLWLDLETQYRPYLKLDGFPFYGEGRRWQAQTHIYKMPFYYIDYCLAQTIALAFWAECQKDRASAWKRYREFVGVAGRDTFTGTIARAGLPSPFVPETLRDLAKVVAAWLDEQPKYV